MYHQFRELADVDITQGPMEVGPTCHYMMGGIRVDAETAQATVPGLFAAGEAAAGLHGANRLGGNSLSDLLVFGRRAGLAAAEQARRSGPVNVDAQQVDEATRELLAPFERGEGDSPYQIHRELEETMQNYVGIFRNEEDLQKGLAELESLNERAGRVKVEGSRLFNPGWHLARDLKSMLTVSKAVALSARERKESRGAHSRIDFPDYDETWSKQNNVIAREGEQMRLKQSPIAEMPSELKEIVLGT
jgi:succinate dehydrogenase / fumarate reductase flavoprotein subunit